MKKSVLIIALLAAVFLVGCPDEPGNGGPSAKGTTLTVNKWVEGNIPAADEGYGEQWFTFTATAATQYIHFEAGTLDAVRIQLYDSNGEEVGDEVYLYFYNPNTTLTVTIGNEYRIRVYSGHVGTYKIALAVSDTPPATLPDTDTLTADTWADGILTATGNENEVMLEGEQWFSFTATADTQYIHFGPGTLNQLSAQLYDSTGGAIGDQMHFATYHYSPNRQCAPLTVTKGKEYSLKVNGWYTDTGTYKIAFNASFAPPGTLTLSADAWADADFTDSAQGAEQWFAFTATADTHYIHFEPGTTLDSLAYMQLYDTNGQQYRSTGEVETDPYYYRNDLRSGTPFPLTVNVGTEYVIRVTSLYINNEQYFGESSGTYRIACNTQAAPPDTTVTALTAGTWTNGNITGASGAQWFKFTATATTHYVHFEPGTLEEIELRVYDSTGTYVGATTSNRLRLTGLETGGEYSVRVQAAGNSSGTYRITFNTLFVPPGTSITTLTANTWAPGNTDSVQWFKFTATAIIHNFHFESDSIREANIYLYNTTGERTDYDASNLRSGNFITRTVIAGNEYYIRISPYGGDTGAYKVGFNTSFAPPEVITLTADTWANGNIPITNGYKTFKFTATAATQYIHVEYGTLKTNNVSIYDNTGEQVKYWEEGSWSNYFTSNHFTCVTLTSGSVYYLRVGSGSETGAFKVGFSALPIPPGVTPSTLNAGTWVNGNIAVAGNSQWFKFTQDDARKWIHFEQGTLGSVRVSLFTNSGTRLGTGWEDTNRTNPFVPTSNWAAYPNNLDEGLYYVMVQPPDAQNQNPVDKGTYRIALGDSFVPPGVTPATITAGTWLNGNIPDSGNRDQWFKHPSSLSTSYVHFQAGELDSVRVAIYRNFANAIYGIGTMVTSYPISLDETTSSVISALRSEETTNDVYWSNEFYIRVYSVDGDTGTYKIAFTTSETSP